MTKEVLVSISGLQMEVNQTEKNEDEPIEVLSAGTYYNKNGKNYLFFEEVAEGIPGITKSQIKWQEDQVLEVQKKGVSNMQMIFEKGKKTKCFYKTPFGQLNLGIFTSEIRVDETEENINIRAEYTLDVDDEPVAECIIRINVKPRDAKDFVITERMEF